MEKRENLFHTRWKVGDYTCNVIIDSGSCANVIASEVMSKLRLAKRVHPKPYKLSWIDYNTSMRVKKEALIAFSIGGYKDELWGDFDRKVIHEGDSNVYSVLVGSKRVRLHPLAPHSVAPKQTPKTPSYFLSSRELEQEVEEKGCAYALVIRHVATSVKTSSNEKLEALMKEFEDVFPEELPQGLPPVRGVKHAIDLVPGAPFPNKPAYRCDPVASRELQRQIEHLIEKGYVRESISPCVVPALLVPRKDVHGGCASIVE
ncbi:uncharacterized protein LOC104906265 [Beta vulgaris subsp. vulgaris]|uniref:uncharacterized protein LOC104906265 n=1 Tax=Beta vulgaris subsp. vulgaris TaxID=3555 RepID=UPI0020371DC8|nr:uncharacterized protein LOC104906265 [Beta vulgaris subsp. vulgaris]